MAFRFPEKSSQHTAELCRLAPRAVPWEGALWWLPCTCPWKGPARPPGPGWELSIIWQKPGKKVQKPLPSLSDADGSLGP